MSFFKQMLSKIGIGAATVETTLYNKTFVPGKPVTGVVNITGGNVAQEIDAIYLTIKSTYEDEIDVEALEDEDGKTVNVTRVAEIISRQLSQPFTLAPEEVLSFDLDFILPFDTPATMGKTTTWVETGLDIKRSLDPGDRDDIKVSLHPMAAQLIESAKILGFRINEVTCEPAPVAMDMRVPFVQEFELKPDRGTFKNRLEEIELVFKPFPDTLQVFMEVDRKAKGLFGHLSEMMGTDETMVHFLVRPDDLPRLTEKLNDIIEQYCMN